MLTHTKSSNPKIESIIACPVTAGVQTMYGAHFLAEIKEPIVTCEAVNTNTLKSATASTQYNKTETDELKSISQDTNNYQETQKIKHVTVYPNPTSDGRFTVSFNYVPASTKIELYNTKGVLQYQNEYHQINELHLNISKLPKGLYFIKIINDNEIFKNKILYQ